MSFSAPKMPVPPPPPTPPVIAGGVAGMAASRVAARAAAEEGMGLAGTIQSSAQGAAKAPTAAKELLGQ